MKHEKWIYALGLLTLSINFSFYLLFLIAAWGGNSSILDYSLVFLFVNSFLVIPLGFPLYFPFGVSKKVKYKVVEDVSALKNFVFMTKTAQFAYSILAKFLWGIAIIAFPISITGYFFGQENLISSIAYPMAFSLLGTGLLLVHTLPFASLMGYSSLWSALVRGKRSFNERISEARMFLLFSRKLLNNNYKKGIALLANAILILNRAVTEIMWAAPRRVEHVNSTLILLEAVEKMDPTESKKGIIKGLNEKISELIDENKLNELPKTLRDFVKEEELESFKGFPVRTKRVISKRSINVFIVTLVAFGTLLSTILLKILEITALQYPHLLMFMGITSALLIISYIFIYQNPPPYPLASSVISALSKKIQNSNNR